jgi:hypothetical protein
MPKIDTEIAEQLPEPLEGHIYKITAAELFTSQVKAYKGLRVNMEEANGTKVVAPLWMRSVAGERSKLGAFIKALGDTTEAWVGKNIKFKAWRQGNREIEVV